MGDVIYLADRRADRLRANLSEPVTFYLDLGSPQSYLAAERIERTFGHVPWVPVRPMAPDPPVSWTAVERAAAALRLPLVWPDQLTSGFPRAHRAAAAAAEMGCGPDFILAALRLAFCGGYDIDDPQILCEAAAAADMPAEDCLAAVVDASLDGVLAATAAGIQRRGVEQLPALRAGGVWREGLSALDEAQALLAVGAAESRVLRGR